MALLLNAASLSKQFGAFPLFTGVSLNIEDGERHGLIGPNGAGKSTLLSILAGRETPDSGEVAPRKGLRLAFVEQDPEFDSSLTVRAILESAAREPAQVPVLLGQAGFTDPATPVGTLSGGSRKRLAIARALAAQPELLLLDEPTNHLDIEGIQWLERLLTSAPFACFIVSHDRYFLENVATHMMELNRRYPEGAFRVAGNYSAFLEKREAWFEAREKEREGLAARVRREVEWLRRGAKARTRKSKARLDEAARMIASLEDMEQRARTTTAAIDFTASDRKTRRLLELESAAAAIAGRTLFRHLNLVLSPGRRLGLAGANGCGKTTLLRLMKGDLNPSEGTIKRADQLKVVYFDQMREQFSPEITLRRALAPEGDSVIYLGRPVHVNSWAKRFLFKEEQLPQPVGSLSGGERARIHIARLMLQEADILLLDEPTNDLDLPTLEVLEEGLLEFPGAMVLVTHDRYLMDRVANGILGLDGEGGAELFADLSQWDAFLREKRAQKRLPEREMRNSSPSAPPPAKRKLSYLEQREFDSIEQRILEADARLEAAQQALHAPDTVSDPARIELCCQEVQQAQQAVDTLYARWAELEDRQAGV
ncbi:MAG: ATP-binding cassette domain-containing protein [Bryobacteraceae bacterium]|nr:ATP-binding cassette domain-containing protein [Bryobacteraceae bacterium]